MKIALVRGPHLNPNGVLPWNYVDQEYEDISITGFKSYPERFDTSDLDMEVRSLRWLDGMVNGFGIEALPWTILGRKGLPRTALLGMRSIANEFDVVHASENFNLFSLQGAIASRNRNAHFVFTAGENIPFFPGNALTWQVKKVVNTHSVAATSTTQAGKRALIHEGMKPKDVRVIPNAVDTDRFDDDARRPDTHRLPDGSEAGFNISFVHGLKEQKGTEYLLRAFSRLQQDRDGVNLLLVGQNNLDERTYSEHVSGAPSVFHLEYIPNEEMSELYNISDVFVLPSITTKTNQEQFGMAVIEAMACGVPSVVTNVGGLPHVVDDGKTSIVIEERSVEELVEALTTLYEDAEYRETLASNSYDYVREHYTPEIVGKRLYDFYHQLR